MHRTIIGLGILFYVPKLLINSCNDARYSFICWLVEVRNSLDELLVSSHCRFFLVSVECYFTSLLLDFLLERVYEQVSLLLVLNVLSWKKSNQQFDLSYVFTSQSHALVGFIHLSSQLIDGLFQVWNLLLAFLVDFIGVEVALASNWHWISGLVNCSRWGLWSKHYFHSQNPRFKDFVELSVHLVNLRGLSVTWLLKS